MYCNDNPPIPGGYFNTAQTYKVWRECNFDLIDWDYILQYYEYPGTFELRSQKGSHYFTNMIRDYVYMYIMDHYPGGTPSFMHQVDVEQITEFLIAKF